MPCISAIKLSAGAGVSIVETAHEGTVSGAGKDVMPVRVELLGSL